LVLGTFTVRINTDKLIVLMIGIPLNNVKRVDFGYFVISDVGRLAVNKNVSVKVNFKKFFIRLK
jgi:hypothetical protein